MKKVSPARKELELSQKHCLSSMRSCSLMARIFREGRSHDEEQASSMVNAAKLFKSTAQEYKKMIGDIDEKSKGTS